MFRTALNVVLLVAAAALVVVGLATYPHIPGGALAAMVATAALLLAPVGRMGAAR
ncbi:hypothetical protein ABZ799_28790 [Nocardiopsis dassonvillei]|uniref:hypothetical protein n=1 Tax=Nocardiopsis dassonvillei TaxID=2014 RepID=UPI0033F8D75A